MSASSTERLWEKARPIRARPHEVFNHGNAELYDVARAVSDINATPTDFQFEVLPIEVLARQVAGRGHLDRAYVAVLSNEDAMRPVLLGRYPDGTVRMLDGYHRAARLMAMGVPLVGAWMLTVAQTDAIRLPPNLVPFAERV